MVRLKLSVEKFDFQHRQLSPPGETNALIQKQWESSDLLTRPYITFTFSLYWAQTRRDLREFVDGPKLAPWRAILVFFFPKRLKSCTNHGKYCMNRDLRVSRSFWAQTRRDLREFFDGPKFAPCRAILGFWPKTLDIMYKPWQLLYESCSTRCRDHFEPKLEAIWENFLTPKNWLLGGLFWVFGPKRWKSCKKHC